MTTHYEAPHISDLVAENVRVLMARTRTKQNTLANALGMTQGAVSKKLNGDRPFTLDEIELVAAHFEVPITDLFEQQGFRVPAATGQTQQRNRTRSTATRGTSSVQSITGEYGDTRQRYLRAVA